jgi:hypothetical protein
MGMTKSVARRAASMTVATAAMAAVLMTPETASAQVQVQGGVGVSVGATAYAPPPPVVYQQPQVVYQQPQVVYQQPGMVYQRPMVLAQPMARRGNVGRFRYGIDAGAGWQFMGYASGFNITASMRLGWQINDQMARQNAESIRSDVASERSGRVRHGRAHRAQDEEEEEENEFGDDTDPEE